MARDTAPTLRAAASSGSAAAVGAAAVGAAAIGAAAVAALGARRAPSGRAPPGHTVGPTLGALEPSAHRLGDPARDLGAAL